VELLLPEGEMRTASMRVAPAIHARRVRSPAARLWPPPRYRLQRGCERQYARVDQGHPTTTTTEAP
jgi:hypothetical protein